MYYELVIYVAYVVPCNNTRKRITSKPILKKETSTEAESGLVKTFIGLAFSPESVGQIQEDPKKRGNGISTY